MDSFDRIIASKIEKRMEVAQSLVDSGLDLPTLLVMVAELRTDHERKLSVMRAQVQRCEERMTEITKRLDDIEPETARPILQQLRAEAKKDSAEIHALYQQVSQQMIAIQATRFVYGSHPDRDTVTSRAVAATDFGPKWWAKHAGDSVGELTEQIKRKLEEEGRA